MYAILLIRGHLILSQSCNLFFFRFYNVHAYMPFISLLHIIYSDTQFVGNIDATSPVTNKFGMTVGATQMRIYPTACEILCSMRMELLGCY